MIFVGTGTQKLLFKREFLLTLKWLPKYKNSNSSLIWIFILPSESLPGYQFFLLIVFDY